MVLVVAVVLAAGLDLLVGEALLQGVQVLGLAFVRGTHETFEAAHCELKHKHFRDDHQYQSTRTHERFRLHHCLFKSLRVCDSESLKSLLLACVICEVELLQ